MKVRIGFVSNSSSSSFCLLGVKIGDGRDILYKAWKVAKEGEFEVEEGIEECDDSVCIGLSPDCMKDEETLLQFKERVLKAVKHWDDSYTVDHLDWITKGGYNG